MVQGSVRSRRVRTPGWSNVDCEKQSRDRQEAFSRDALAERCETVCERI
jgi:hypothetical protein